MLAALFVTNLGDGLRLPALPLLISGIAAALFLPWTTF
ncbi:MAG: hypothetical protein ACI9BK_001969, partial [Acidimicrobiales bacterium]